MAKRMRSPHGGRVESVWINEVARGSIVKSVVPEVWVPPQLGQRPPARMRLTQWPVCMGCWAGLAGPTVRPKAQRRDPLGVALADPTVTSSFEIDQWGNVLLYRLLPPSRRHSVRFLRPNVVRRQIEDAVHVGCVQTPEAFLCERFVSALDWPVLVRDVQTGQVPARNGVVQDLSNCGDGRLA